MKKFVKLLIVVTFDLHSFDDFFFMQKISKPQNPNYNNF